MLKRHLLVALFAAGLLAACGGQEPTPTPVPPPTFTPTSEPTAAPPTQVPTEVPATATEAAPAAVTEVTTEVPTEAAAPAGGALESPLAAPISPLVTPVADNNPAPTAEAAAAPTAAPTSAPVLTSIAGLWQLETMQVQAGTQPITVTGDYQVALWNSGATNVTADCRTGRGDYTVDAEAKLTFDLVFNNVRCTADSLAEGFVNALNNVNSYGVEDGKLKLGYGDQGGELTLTSVQQMASFGDAILKWSRIRNTTFMIDNAAGGGNQVPLLNGEYHAKTAAAPTEPGANNEFSASLLSTHTTADLDGDGTLDTLVLLDVNRNAITNTLYLIPILNAGGIPIPVVAEPLGDGVSIRNLYSVSPTVTIELDALGAGDAAPSEGTRRTYTFDNDHLKLANEEKIGAPPIQSQVDAPVQDVAFTADSAATVTGTLPFNGIQPFRVPLQAGQQLTIALESPSQDVWLSIYGEGDNVVVRSIKSQSTTWSGIAPSSQNFIINAVAVGSTTPFTLTITPASPVAVAVDHFLPVRAGRGELAQAAPADAKVVYLTFNTAPSAATTTAILDTLARNQAVADFYVSATEPVTPSDTIGAIWSAGNGIGVLASGARALSNSSGDQLFAQVSAAHTALGDQVNTCLRLPYGLDDAYTRAAATELGYQLVQWDIDARDAAGASADEIAAVIPSTVTPGAVVLLHATDAAAQTPAALEKLLPALTQQGYTFGSRCRPQPQGGPQNG